MILETMTPLDFMDFRLVSEHLITGRKTWIEENKTISRKVLF